MATFLLPCLVFGLATWSLEILKRKSGRLSAAATIAAGAALVSASLFSYNRAAVIVPAVVFMGVYALHIRRVRVLHAVLALVGLAVLASVVTNLRSSATEEQLRGIGADPKSFAGYHLGLNELQLYGGAPQFVAFGFTTAPSSSPGVLTVNSIITPVPKYGSAGRANNGIALYNGALYGRSSGVEDQSVPTVVELNWDFGPGGVLLGFLLFGTLIGACHRRFVYALTPSEALAWGFAGTWAGACLIFQLETLSQIAIYWSVPLALLIFRTPRQRRA
ncbi:MAG: hypothetical protein JWR90_456 [Marmoricola sp.]|nr:hypothetical protein [Marmoricola sp.]